MAARPLATLEGRSPHSESPQDLIPPREPVHIVAQMGRWKIGLHSQYLLLSLQAQRSAMSQAKARAVVGTVATADRWEQQQRASRTSSFRSIKPLPLLHR